MPLTYRDEKGSPLTSTEVDANFRQVVADNVTTDGKAVAARTVADAAKVKADGSVQQNEKGVADGVASLDSSGKVPAEQLPAGQTLASTDDLPEGTTNKYWTLPRTLGAVLTGMVLTNPAVVAVTDSILIAIGKLQRQVSDNKTVADAAKVKADAALPAANVGMPNGVASLDANGLVPSAQLPSYVDDVLEFNTLAAMPRPGESGKIYVALNTSRQYRWPQDGVDYVELVASPGTTDNVTEGTVNKYWTNARTIASVLTGMVLTNATAVAAADTIVVAFGKVQRQINDIVTSVTNKANKGANTDITSIGGLTTPLSVSQGGWGGATAQETTNANATLNNGHYSTPSTGWTGSVFPGADAKNDGYLFMDNYNANYAFQTWRSIDPTVTTRQRWKVAGVWGDWAESSSGSGGGLPVGAIQPWGHARANLPAGWIARDGQILNRADWPDLWALVAGTAVTDAVWLAAPYTSRGKYSSGDGSTTFRMPDTNAKHADGNTIGAMVLRGDGKNSAGTPGLHQADQLQGFTLGPVDGWDPVQFPGYASTTTTAANLTQAFYTPRANPWTQTTRATIRNDGTNGTPRVGSETRMNNETVIMCTVGAGKAVNPGTVDVTALATTVSNQSSQIAALPLTKVYESAQTAWTVGQLLTFTHGLGVIPKLTELEAVVTVAQGGAVVGDRFVPTILINGTQFLGAQVVTRTATTVTVRCASGMCRIVSGTSSDVITAANCQIVLRCWG